MVQYLGIKGKRYENPMRWTDDVQPTRKLTCIYGQSVHNPIGYFVMYCMYANVGTYLISGIETFIIASEKPTATISENWAFPTDTSKAHIGLLD